VKGKMELESENRPGDTASGNSEKSELLIDLRSQNLSRNTG